MMYPAQDAYIERINKGEETYSAEGLAAIVREIFIIGAESESVLMRWKFDNLYKFWGEVIQNGCAQTMINQDQVPISWSRKD